MDSLSTTDVMFGMHGAGWTNGLFIKRGATTMQMFPYGWRLPDKSTLRGFNYREIVLASECPYEEWVNPVRENAFFRRSDYSKKSGWNMTYSLHPEPNMPLPQDGWPGNLWIVSFHCYLIGVLFIGFLEKGFGEGEEEELVIFTCRRQEKHHSQAHHLNLINYFILNSNVLSFSLQYQNTYVDMNLFGPEIDRLMDKAGISLMHGV
jgi:hypothetical protein